MTTDRNHDRATGSTAISFSCSQEMKRMLTQLAETEHRTLSNYLQAVLLKHIERARSLTVKAPDS